MEIRKFSTRNEGMKVFGSKGEGKEDHPGSDGGIEDPHGFWRNRRDRPFRIAGNEKSGKIDPWRTFLEENETEDKTCRRAGKRLSDRSGENGPRSGGRRKEKPGRIRAKNRPKTHRPGTESLRKKSAPEKGRLQVRG